MPRRGISCCRRQYFMPAKGRYFIPSEGRSVTPHQSANAASFSSRRSHIWIALRSNATQNKKRTYLHQRDGFRRGSTLLDRISPLKSYAAGYRSAAVGHCAAASAGSLPPRCLSPGAAFHRRGSLEQGTPPQITFSVFYCHYLLRYQILGLLSRVSWSSIVRERTFFSRLCSIIRRVRPDRRAMVSASTFSRGTNVTSTLRRYFRAK